MIALLDGDIIAYRSAASCEPTKIKPDREPLEAAVGRADDLVRRILQETQATSHKLFIGGDNNFRYAIDANYKAHRKDMPKPQYLQEVRGFLVSTWGAEITDGIEADDALGIHQDKKETYQTTENHPDCLTTICSIDKDLLQVPGWHYNFVQQVRSFTDELTGLHYFYQQLIQGDHSDNIMGYDGKARPKIPKFLQPIIDDLWSMDDERSMYNLVFSLYMDDERMHRNAQLLYIQRKEGDVWQPPSRSTDPN